ncbi:hypothetical protein HMPREF1324_2331 [Rothia aeria F0474]|uniref:Uncharacterized protein n=1 Tax=Rothia aeria F0474 TaxID=1125724 RepID=I0UQK3_9MICC|nr:hypothetical protein HMPREF1324_2331 [Rothia aeria F0474]
MDVRHSCSLYGRNYITKYKGNIYKYLKITTKNIYTLTFT